MTTPNAWTPAQVLATPMEPDDSGADTIRGYLVDLLAKLWRERAGFSGKRPFGESGWEYDLYYPLVKAGLVAGSFDEDGALDAVDREAADRLIAEAIQALGATARVWRGELTDAYFDAPPRVIDDGQNLTSQHTGAEAVARLIAARAGIDIEILPGRPRVLPAQHGDGEAEVCAEVQRVLPEEQPPTGAPVSCRYRTEIGSEYWVHADRSVSYHSRPPSQLVAITADQIEADAAAGHLTPFRVSGDAPEGTA